MPTHDPDPRVPLPLAYEERVVAFLDVLGWRNLVDRSTKDTSLIRQMGSALAYLRIVGSDLPRASEDWLRFKAEAAGEQYRPEENRLEFAQFSDSIVISGKVNMLNALAFHVGGIIQTFFYHGFLLRGGISEGWMFHKGSVAFGPALTAAYDLGNKPGSPPRVVFDSEMLDGQDAWESASPESRFFSMFRKGTDGLWFLDFLNPLMMWPPENKTEKYATILHTYIQPRLQNYRRLIIEGLTESSGTQDVYKKYLWLAEYFNEVNREHQGALVQLIELPFK